MPRSFDLAAEYPRSIEQVHSVFSDEEYWLARLADSGADTASLDSLAVDDDGSVRISTTQALRQNRLPGWVTQFHRGDLQIVRNEKWSPIEGAQARAEVTGAVPGAPVSLVGSAVLGPADGGSRLTFTVTVEVRVPLVGPKIENFVESLLAQFVVAEQRFTTMWLLERA